MLPKSFLHPCLLLLLDERAGYGYDLVSRLKDLKLDDDSAAVYRALRKLEQQGAISSYWCTSSAGPARRMYSLTSTGQEQLQAAVEAIVETHQAIERFFCRHALAQRPGPERHEGATPPTVLNRLIAHRSAG